MAKRREPALALALALALLLPVLVGLVGGGRTAEAAEPPTTTLDFELPPYTVTKFGPYDRVTIPGGLTYAEEEGRPEVPIYQKVLDCPPGYRVQEVDLAGLAAAETSTGLSLPVVQLDPQGETAVEAKPGWYPDQTFSWTFSRNPDGSGRLTITVFPFYYDPQTTDIWYFRNWSFGIVYSTSTVLVTAIVLDETELQPGQHVTGTIGLRNTGATADVLAAVDIKRHGSGDPVGGMPLRWLRGLDADASLALDWDSSPSGSGSYTVEVTLSDGGAVILDQATAEFTVLKGAVRFWIGQARYTVGDVEYQMDVAPYIKEGRTFLPVRFVAYACGVTDEGISWDGATRTVRLTKGDKTMTLTIGSKTMTVTTPGGTTTVQMDVAPEITAGRTMLPVRWIAEQAGYTVSWDGAAQMVILEP